MLCLRIIKQLNNMNNLFLFVFFLLFMIVNSMNDNRFYDRDDDIQNRLTNINHYSVLPMKGGGGWPSTTGNPSGGGRWNN